MQREAVRAASAGSADRFAVEQSTRLGQRWVHCHPRTLRRYLLGLPGELYLLGSDRLLVVIHAQRLRSLNRPPAHTAPRLVTYRELPVVRRWALLPREVKLHL